MEICPEGELKESVRLNSLGKIWSLIIQCIFKTQRGRKTCIHLNHGWDCSWAVLNLEMYVWVPQEVGNFLDAQSNFSLLKWNTALWSYIESEAHYIIKGVPATMPCHEEEMWLFMYSEMWLCHAAKLSMLLTEILLFSQQQGECLKIKRREN